MIPSLSRKDSEKPQTSKSYLGIFVQILPMEVHFHNCFCHVR
jgi:hypothetical protein